MDKGVTTEAFLFGAFRLDRRASALFRRDERGAAVPVAIGSRGFAVLDMLVARHGELVSKDEIMRAVWPETVVEDNNLTVQISALRRVLDDGRTQGSCIQTIPGRGYRFIPAVTLVEGDKIALAALSISQPAVAPRLSIVVLPFANLGNDPEQQYFADGITEDLTTDLSRIEGMLVISRNTAFTYWGKQVDTKQIGRELCVRYVLEGSVRRSGSRVRVSAQLIDAATDAHLWAERFDGDTGDLFALQDEITSRIAVALNLELTAAEAARPTDHPDALDYILRGRAVRLTPNSRDSLAQAISSFEHALAIDPRSVEAQSRLANTLASRAMDDMTDSPAADIARAEGLVQQAVTASPRSSHAHYAKAQVLRAQAQVLGLQRRYDGAIAEYRTAFALDRSLVFAIAAVGRCKLSMGSLDEVIPLMEEAISLSPRDPYISDWYQWIGLVHLFQSRTEEAIVWLERACSIHTAHSFKHLDLASAYALNGEGDRAAAELAEARRLATSDIYSSIARLRTRSRIPKRYESVYFAGLRKAGMAEE